MGFIFSFKKNFIGVLIIYVMVSGFAFLWDVPVCLYLHVSLVLFLCLNFPPICFVLFWPDYFTLFFNYFYIPVCFLMREKVWIWMGGEVERI